MRLGISSCGASTNFGDVLIPQLVRWYLGVRVPDLEVVEYSWVEGGPEYGMRDIGDRMEEIDALLLLGGSLVFEDALLGTFRGGWLESFDKPLIVWGGVQWRDELSPEAAALRQAMVERADLLLWRFPEDIELGGGGQGQLGGDPLLLTPRRQMCEGKITLSLGSAAFKDELRPLEETAAWAFQKFPLAVMAECTSSGSNEFEFPEGMPQYGLISHVLYHCSTAQYMGSTRLHPLVCHIAQGRPGAALDRSGKLRGLLSAVGCEALWTDNPDSFRSCLEASVDGWDEFSSHVAENLPALQEATRNALEQIVKICVED
jgi:hypothetical protein